ncbi:hypothetical protein ES695_07305 [Candidatus Atribacteria bacterium 1244-E10-H5-B2]|nr:MAG: hypothetical protein ES695_07305 [Candidatus Atribacteria bacterium 1244-E10-H5-B2]
MNLKEVEEIDEPIRDIIKDLNSLGYDTNSSCAGYRYPGHQDKTDKSKIFQKPYVTFYSTLTKAHRLDEELLNYFWDIQLFQGQFEMHFNTKYGGNSQKAKKQSWEGVRIALKALKKKEY